VSFQIPYEPHGFFADPETRRPLPRHVRVVQAEFCDDGTRDMILIRPILYIDPKGAPCYVPVGSRSNGLSVWVRLLWPLVWPWEPLTRNAAFIHDEQVRNGVRWNLAAWRFYHAMIAMFVRADRNTRWNRARAFIRWMGVQFIGGPCYWVKGWFRYLVAKVFHRRVR
jgi:hypothetical protein